MNHEELRERLENIVNNKDADTDVAISRLNNKEDIEKEKIMIGKHKEFVAGINTSYMIICRLEKIPYQAIKSKYSNY